MRSNRPFLPNSLPGGCRRTRLGKVASLCVAALSCAAGAAYAQAPSGVRITELSETSHPYATWHCARLPIKTRMIGQALEVVVDGDSRILLPAISASGARYVAPDDAGTEFWSKGGLANATWSGAALPVCAQEGTLVTPLRASGNEPFWAMDYDGWRIALSEPGQPVRHFDVDGQTPSAGGWRLQAAEGQASWQVDITEAVCQDSMSGLPRPYSVVLNMNEQPLQGCGGDPARLLQGVRWTLQTLGDTAVKVAAWLEFLPDNRLAGSNGCNRLMGGYDISGEGIGFSQLGTTRMACAPEVMRQSAVVDQYLATVRGFSFDEQGALVLHAEQGRIVAVAAD